MGIDRKRFSGAGSDPHARAIASERQRKADAKRRGAARAKRGHPVVVVLGGRAEWYVDGRIALELADLDPTHVVTVTGLGVLQREAEAYAEDTHHDEAPVYWHRSMPGWGSNARQWRTQCEAWALGWGESGAQFILGGHDSAPHAAPRHVRDGWGELRAAVERYAADSGE